eukprot:1281878-Amphidinium_carterae.1
MALIIREPCATGVPWVLFAQAFSREVFPPPDPSWQRSENSARKQCRRHKLTVPFESWEH